MSDHSRIEDLRRRVQKDPTSIAFAQLAEEHRRAGQLDEAVEAARAGLVQHPAYLSARVTLGRALLELGRLDEAAAEFEYVVQAAPDNLTAVRQLAEIHQRRRQSTNESKSRQPEAAHAPGTASASAPASSAASSLRSSPARAIATPFVVELTSQTATVASAPPDVRPAPAVAAPPPPPAPPMAVAPPSVPAEPIDPVIAELETWLAVIEEQRAARHGAPGVGGR